MQTSERRKAQRRAASARYAASHPDRIKANREAQRGKQSGWARAWRRRNPEAVKAKDARWKRAHPDRCAVSRKKWLARNRHVLTARGVARRARQISASPAWANNFFISEIYGLARLRTTLLGVEHHVDHIVPLRSKRVCGLHVEHNLRVIPASDNRLKNNLSWPDMQEVARASS